MKDPMQKAKRVNVTMPLFLYNEAKELNIKLSKLIQVATEKAIMEVKEQQVYDSLLSSNL